MSDAEEIILSKGTRVLLKERAGKGNRGCLLCRMILEDFKLHKKLTGHPLNGEGKPMFPVEAKVAHIANEKGDPPKESPPAAPPARTESPEKGWGCAEGCGTGDPDPDKTRRK